MITRKVSFMLAVVLSFMVLAATFSSAFFFSRHAKVTAVDGEVLIPLHKVNDGDAYYFSYTHQGRAIQFFVIRSADGVLRAAFDACDVCYQSKKGYTREGDFMICNNCGRKFHSNRINILEGGCNPAPLQRAERGENLVIKVADIVQGARYF
jgi:uncharacterized membrane protein